MTAVLGEMLVEIGVERERLLVTPNGVHLEQYGPATSAARTAARAELGLARLGAQRSCSASSATTATGTAWTW